MSKIHYVNVQSGKKEYSFGDVKSMDANTFKNVFSNTKAQEKMSVVTITQEQRDFLKKGEKISSAEIGAANTNEVKALAEEKNLLSLQLSEKDSEIQALQRQLAELQKPKAEGTEETQEAKTPSKKTK